MDNFRIIIPMNQAPSRSIKTFAERKEIRVASSGLRGAGHSFAGVSWNRGLLPIHRRQAKDYRGTTTYD